jgi:hypothetical protein
MTKGPKTLEDQITDARRTISSEGYPMSIGELTNLYRDGELNVRPEFQRFFRWTDMQKSRLVESLLLGIPLPSIFVAQTEDGTWELVDGLQRVSTILQLQGLLEDEDGHHVDPLILEGTKYLPALEGRQWEHQDKSRSLSQAQRLDIKRSKIDVKIIKRESSPAAKYDLFQRLNSYGMSFTAQEMRSALLISVSADFFSWVEKLASHAAFVETVALSERLVDEKYDLELVLRWLVLHSRPQSNITQQKLRDFPQFMDDSSIRLAEGHPEGTDALEDAFVETFETIRDNGGEDIFRKWDPNRGEFRGPFLNTAYEVFALGLGYHISSGGPYRTDLVQAARELWERPRMARGFATGRSTEARLAEFVPLGRELLGG